jgi:hypothetical protein
MSKLIRMLLVGFLALSSAPQVSAQSGDRCFAETGFCINGRIRQFWEQNGGLAVFGFPIGSQQEQLIEGRPVQAQNFERNRLELHPENSAPYDVLLGRLGADRLAQQGRDWQAVFPKSEPQTGCRFFAETGHNVCGEILVAWRANGLEIDGKRGKTEAENLALFGLPLSGMVTETSSDGKPYQMQWFERARFELHPENQPPYNVLLGLLGNELRDNAKPAAPPPPVAAPAPAPAPPPASFNNCQADPNSAAAPNFPIRIIALDKRKEVVTLKNVSSEAINLDGWRLCSIRGNQEIPVGGTIAPGESRGFGSTDGSSWNNSEKDDGALYNPAGQLISYWND